MNLETNTDVWTHRVKLPERYTTDDLKRAEDIMNALKTLDIQCDATRHEYAYSENWIGEKRQGVEYIIEPLTTIRRIHKKLRV